MQIQNGEFDPVTEEDTYLITESYGPQVMQQETQIKRESQSLPKKIVKKKKKKENKFENMPFSMNIGEAYEQQSFGNKLRRICKNKFEEDLLKIQMSTEALIRKEQFENMQQKEKSKNHQDHSAHVQKQTILSRMKEFHQKRYPQVNLEKFLTNESNSLTRSQLLHKREKKIHDELEKKNTLQRQQDIIIMSLSPHTRTKIGFGHFNKQEKKQDQEKVQEKDEANNSELQQQYTQGLQSKNPSSRSPSSFRETKNVMVQEQIMTQSKIETNQQTTVQPPVKKRPWVMLLQKREARASSAMQGQKKFSLLNQSIHSQIKSTLGSYNFNNNSNNSNNNNNSNKEVLQEPKVNELNQNNEQNMLNYYQNLAVSQNQWDYQNASLNQFLPKTNITQNVSPKNIQDTNNSQNSLPQRFVRRKLLQEPSQQPVVVKSKIEQARERRKFSPLKFIFTKYEGIVSEFYDDFRQEMKEIANLYLANPPISKARNSIKNEGQTLLGGNAPTRNNQRAKSILSPSQNQQQFPQIMIQSTFSNPQNSTPIQGNQFLLSPPSLQIQPRSISLNQPPQLPLSTPSQSIKTRNLSISYNESTTQENFSTQQTPLYQPQQQNNNQKNQELSISIQRESFISTPQQKKSITIYDRWEKEKGKHHKQAGQMKESSYFLEKNKEIQMKNDKLNKTLMEFQKENGDLKQEAIELQKSTNQQTKNLEGFVPSQFEEQCNVIDFLRNARFEKEQQQIDHQGKKWHMNN